MNTQRAKKVLRYLIGSAPIGRLVKVCAWCPKSTYPHLAHGQEYTHGLCRMHYAKLTAGKKVTPLLTIIGISILNVLRKLDERLTPGLTGRNV